MNPLTQTDAYKLSHKGFMAEGTTVIYANFTARSPRLAQWAYEERKVLWLGLQHFVKENLIEEWNREFFSKPLKSVIAKFKHRVDTFLGPDSVSMDHFVALHKLGYLPIRIKSLPEGCKIGFKVPLLTVVNTKPEFAWLVTYLETLMSQELWGTTTSATMAYQFLLLCNKFADETCDDRLHVMFQCHDFSARGMFGRHAAALSGLGHLACFSGTDTIAAIDLVERDYNVDAAKFFIAGSVPASEHSVTSLGIAVKGELGTLREWLTERYPTGIVSIVSDTIDYWKVITEYLPVLKPEIMARQPNAIGLCKTVVRPDSGDPVRIICGYESHEIYQRKLEDGTTVYEDKETGKALTLAEVLGSIQCLWDTFGGTINSKGYKVLDPHIGLIYGDSITLERARSIFERLRRKGFASSNVVFGVGSYTYQHVTRDTLGMAVKATYAVVDGKGLPLFKDPKTDSGVKKSARGLLRVDLVGDEFVLTDNVTEEQEKGGALRTVFEDGKLLIEDTFDIIRQRVAVGT